MIVAKYIKYDTVATIIANSYYGMESTGEIYMQRPEYTCNQPLLYAIIDGALPTGLQMASNGYIYGTLPMLDVDDYNKNLPTSNTWYEKIHDNEYVTSWGRYYRFKVHLYLEGFYEKGEERWFWISILNDFNKNLRFVDQYTELEDERIVTFEEQVKLDTIRLCPDPCGIEDIAERQNSDSIVSVIDGEVYENLS